MRKVLLGWSRILADPAPAWGDEPPLRGRCMLLAGRCGHRRACACGRSCLPRAGLPAVCGRARIHHATTRRWPHSPPA
ncbi:hypothetical protein XANMN_02375 [Xanthomonas phaseoli pv. manihotis str. CIO151]|nr:hypothetical protein XANMN_02375 [Xanthomonas phaseoli pv. manihotis str. CIO151]